MAKFNTGLARRPRPATGSAEPTISTHEGAPAYERSPKAELFLLAVSNMVGENAFYEVAPDRDARYEALVRTCTIADPAWTADLLQWLRTSANMRSASLVGAAIFAHERLAAHLHGMSRQVLASVLQRADEPGEMLAYWTTRFGRNIPKPVKRGIADAVARLYTQRSLLKYDTASHGFRFADVIDLAHPTPAADKPWQGDLFTHSLDRRHSRGNDIPPSLTMLVANATLRRAAADDPSVLLDPDALAAAGMTWEDVLSLAGSTLDKARLWTALIPTMGYMALLRNLRNFDEAGVCDEVAARVAAKLADPAQVARSRQFPYRFLSAHLAAPSQRWDAALDQALAAATGNIPALAGRTLVLVDTSASMAGFGMSERSKVTPAWAAALFGVALAARNPGAVDLVGFASRTFGHQVHRGASVLAECERFLARIGEVGHGTEIAFAVRAAYAGHDRVIVISDMQTMDAEVSAQVPAHVPMYGFNLGGYRPTVIPPGGPNRYELGGLTDATFSMIPLLEAGEDWPWLQEQQPLAVAAG